MTWRVVFTHEAREDAKNLVDSALRFRVDELLDILREDPFLAYPPYEMLAGNLQGAYSRRINIQHRVVYQVLEQEKVVKVIRV